MTTPKKMSVKDVYDTLDDDLPDGAWWAMMQEMTGLSIEAIAEKLVKLGLAKEYTP